MQYRNRLLLSKIGVGSYPTDPVPAAMANAIKTRDLDFTPFEGNTETLEYDGPSLGSGEEVDVGPHGRLTFKVDLAGSGELGEPPPWGVLMRMSGWAETIEADTEVVYSLLSKNFEWGSHYFNNDGQLAKLLGSRGNGIFNMNAGASPFIDLNMLGLFDQTPTAVAMGVPDFDAFQKPLPVNSKNTPTFTIDGFAAKMEALTFNPGFTPEYRNVVNQEWIPMTDRKGTASVTLEEPLLADKDLYALVRSRATVNVQIIHGLVPGNIIQVDAKAQVRMRGSSNSQGIVARQFDLILRKGTDDELTVTVR